MNLTGNEISELHSKGLIEQLIGYVGTHCSLKVILSLDDLLSNNKGGNGTLFEKFLNKLKENKIITKEIFRQFRNFDDDSESQKTPLLENSGLILDKGDSQLEKSAAALILNKKKYSDVIFWSSPFLSPKTKEKLPHNYKAEFFRKMNHLYCSVENKEGKDVYDESGLQLSSYSLTSAALLDSSSEDECKIEEGSVQEKDSSKVKHNRSEVSSAAPLKKVTRKRTSSINRIKLLLFNLTNQKVTSSPCISLRTSENSFNTLGLKLI